MIEINHLFQNSSYSMCKKGVIFIDLQCIFQKKKKKLNKLIEIVCIK
jgi:hypothetical protein